MKIFYTLLFSLFLFIMGFSQEYDYSLKGHGKSKDRIVVSEKGKYGIISSHTKEIIVPLEYSFIKQYNDNLFKIEAENNKIGLVDKSGKDTFKTRV